EHGMLAWIGAVMSVVFLGALVVTGIGLAVRQRWGLVASLGASGFLVADSIACPLTGHHEFGAFIVVQAVASVALAGATSRVARPRGREPRRPPRDQPRGGSRARGRGGAAAPGRTATTPQGGSPPPRWWRASRSGRRSRPAGRCRAGRASRAGPSADSGPG